IHDFSESIKSFDRHYNPQIDRFIRPLNAADAKSRAADYYVICEERNMHRCTYGVLSEKTYLRVKGIRNNLGTLAKLLVS
ncbi:MAG: hypothetical protein KAI35_07810, partial [Desulfobulbaceae bacterium]|nr:hypothetical protein [Desulfobulbaceae bacterium]